MCAGEAGSQLDRLVSDLTRECVSVARSFGFGFGLARLCWHGLCNLKLWLSTHASVAFRSPGSESQVPTAGAVITRALHESPWPSL